MRCQIFTERDHLRQLLENDSKNSSLAPSMAVTVALRQVLQSITEYQYYKDNRGTQTGVWADRSLDL